MKKVKTNCVVVWKANKDYCTEVTSHCEFFIPRPFNSEKFGQLVESIREAYKQEHPVILNIIWFDKEKP